MNKVKITALLAALIMLFSGCSLVSVDEERVANQVVASINGEEIYKYEVDEVTAIYGLDADTEDEAARAQYEEVANSVLDSLALNIILFQKAADLGIELTDEEIKENEKQSKEIFSNRKEAIRTEVEEEAAEDETIDIEQEIEKRYQEYVENMEATPETYVETINRQSIVYKVQDYIYGLASVTDEEVKDWYDQTLEIQKEQMDASEAAFSQYVNNNNILTYVPEDTVAVKQVLLKFKDEDLVSEAMSLFSDDKKEEMLELLKPEIDALMPIALEVKQRLEDGEDIDALIEELGEDEGMTQHPGSVYGYLVEKRTKSYLPEFTKAALGLFTVGDVSDPAITYYGLHILQSIKFYKKGVVPFEELKDDIYTALLPIREQEIFDETTQTWLEEADTVYYRNRLM